MLEVLLGALVSGLINLYASEIRGIVSSLLGKIKSLSNSLTGALLDIVIIGDKL
jgi:hypothetical protein